MLRRYITYATQYYGHIVDYASFMIHYVTHIAPYCWYIRYLLRLRWADEAELHILPYCMLKIQRHDAITLAASIRRHYADAAGRCHTATWLRHIIWWHYMAAITPCLAAAWRHWLRHYDYEPMMRYCIISLLTLDRCYAIDTLMTLHITAMPCLFIIDMAFFYFAALRHAFYYAAITPSMSATYFAFDAAYAADGHAILRAHCFSPLFLAIISSPPCRFMPRSPRYFDIHILRITPLIRAISSAIIDIDYADYDAAAIICRHYDAMPLSLSLIAMPISRWHTPLLRCRWLPRRPWFVTPFTPALFHCHIDNIYDYAAILRYLMLLQRMILPRLIAWLRQAAWLPLATYGAVTSDVIPDMILNIHTYCHDDEDWYYDMAATATIRWYDTLMRIAAYDTHCITLPRFRRYAMITFIYIDTYAFAI